MTENKIRSFVDLNAWQEGHRLVLLVYISTAKFPKEEIFVLTPQMRRCVISITCNIAEGFSRKTQKEKMQFYYISLGSITELQNQLIIARDLKYLSDDKFKQIAEQSTKVQKLVNGLVKSSKSLFIPNT